MRADPHNGSPWIRWARAFERSDADKTVGILERGLAVSGLRNRRDLLETALDVGENLGRLELVERARRELQVSPSVPEAATPRRGKVGRNEPCPCGSGVKYKKCCLNTAAR